MRRFLPLVQEKIFSSFDTGQILLATSKDKFISVAFILFKNPLALELIDALMTMADKNIELLKSSELIEVIDCKKEKFTVHEAEKANKIIIKIGLKDNKNDELVTNIFYRAARGKVLLEIASQNLELIDEYVRDMFTKIFNRLEQINPYLVENSS